MDKRAEFRTALNEAMKSKKKEETSTIRLILAALKDRDITARSQGKADGIEDGEILSMLATMIKQRQESAKMYAEAERIDLAEQEELEIGIIQKFMPPQLEAEEVESVIGKLIEETGATCIKDMGKVMGLLKDRYAGQVDMGKAGGMVKTKLG